MINFLYIIKFLECGHFCLRYILKKDNKKVSCVYNRDMMSLALVTNVLNEYYSEVVWYKNMSLDKIEGRCITLMVVRKKYYHYIVIERVSDEYVFYYDPMFLNIRRVKKDKFERKWSKIVCLYA